MEIVLSCLHLSDVGGMQSYSLTVASGLQQLGHGLTLYAQELGTAASLAEARGLNVVGSASDLPDDCDAVIAQDAVTALELADRIPDTPRLFVAHGAEIGVLLPPQVAGAVAATVAMNDRVARRLETLSEATPVVRLRQPVDLTRFAVRGPLRPTPRRVVLLGNHLAGDRRAAITSVCEDRGLEWIQFGAGDRRTDEPERDLASADIVVGYGRSVVEAMAVGRAAYVYDRPGGDGWVTPTSYPRLEADGFAGLATDVGIDAEAFRADLDAYHEGMGPANWELARRHHHALDHAEQLVRTLRDLGNARPAAIAAGRVSSRLVQREYAAQAQVQAMNRHVEELTDRLHGAELRAQEAALLHQTLTTSRRWRLACRISQPFDRLRALLRR